MARATRAIKLAAAKAKEASKGSGTRRFVGLDVHKRVVQACVIDQSGNVLLEIRFDLTRESVSEFARAHLDAMSDQTMP
jgi:hypothetical protein